MDPYKFYCSDIYNGDGMCIKTIQELDRITAIIPMKQTALIEFPREVDARFHSICNNFNSKHHSLNICISKKIFGILHN